jgi:catechol 2,3-dioxygenase-like lactoylglutathione lyase family enzyme
VDGALQGAPPVDWIVAALRDESLAGTATVTAAGARADCGSATGGSDAACGVASRVPRLLSIVPAVPVRDLDVALRFYCDKLHFRVRHRENDGGGAILERDSAELHLTRLDDESWKARADFGARPVKSGAESFLPGTASFRIEVDDVRALYAECASGGVVHAKAPLREQGWGDVDFGVGDPDGNLLTFFQRALRADAGSR